MSTRTPTPRDPSHPRVIIRNQDSGTGRSTRIFVPRSPLPSHAGGSPSPPTSSSSPSHPSPLPFTPASSPPAASKSLASLLARTSPAKRSSSRAPTSAPNARPVTPTIPTSKKIRASLSPAQTTTTTTTASSTAVTDSSSSHPSMIAQCDPQVSNLHHTQTLQSRLGPPRTCAKPVKGPLKLFHKASLLSNQAAPEITPVLSTTSSSSSTTTTPSASLAETPTTTAISPSTAMVTSHYATINTPGVHNSNNDQWSRSAIDTYRQSTSSPTSSVVTSTQYYTPDGSPNGPSTPIRSRKHSLDLCSLRQSPLETELHEVPAKPVRDATGDSDSDSDTVKPDDCSRATSNTQASVYIPPYQPRRRSRHKPSTIGSGYPSCRSHKPNSSSSSKTYHTTTSSVSSINSNPSSAAKKSSSTRRNGSHSSCQRSRSPSPTWYHMHNRHHSHPHSHHHHSSRSGSTSDMVLAHATQAISTSASFIAVPPPIVAVTFIASLGRQTPDHLPFTKPYLQFDLAWKTTDRARNGISNGVPRAAGARTKNTDWWDYVPMSQYIPSWRVRLAMCAHTVAIGSSGLCNGTGKGLLYVEPLKQLASTAQDQADSSTMPTSVKPDDHVSPHQGSGYDSDTESEVEEEQAQPEVGTLHRLMRCLPVVGGFV